MTQEILRIVITPDGDELAYSADIWDSKLEEFKKSFPAESHTWGSVHIHSENVYGGFTEWHQMGNYQVVVCRSCKLRVKVPLTVKTIKDLMEWAEGESNG